MMADLVETVARIIDPSRWRVFDSYLADMLRKYKGEHIGYDPEAFKDKASMAKAQAAIAAVFDALETPSEGMINCGAGAVINHPDSKTVGTIHRTLKNGFPAMLAKAREEMLNDAAQTA